MKTWIVLAALVLSLDAFAAQNQECVVLLHGLCRTSRSMIPMEKALAKAGYKVVNVNYPSRSALIEKLSEDAIGHAVNECHQNGAVAIHFVTHSLGGILVRSYLARHSVTNLGRVVMLAPPNQGSELVDRLGSFWLFRMINGPAGSELGTKHDSTPNKLGAPAFPVGIIAGKSSINWINSLIIPGSDDGKVSVERTKLEGMADHVIICAPHPFIMRNRTAIHQTIHFLQTGQFDRQLSAKRNLVRSGFCLPSRSSAQMP